MSYILGFQVADRARTPCALKAEEKAEASRTVNRVRSLIG